VATVVVSAWEKELDRARLNRVLRGEDDTVGLADAAR
jgi:aerobic C4-dicarboxylate transport protein